MASQSLTDSLQETLELFETGGAPVTTTEVADRLDLGRRSSYDRLDRLVDHGYIKTKKVGANGRVWWLPLPSEQSNRVSEPTDGSTNQLEDHQELEHGLSQVFERIDDAFFALDEEWQFTHVNEQAATLLDRSADSLVGAVVWEEFPDAVDSTFQDQYKRAIKTQKSVSFEEWYPPLDTWFEVAAYPSESGLSVYFRDITDRKERERELQRYKTIIETVDDGIYVVDPDGCFTLVNESYASMVGYSCEALIDEPVSKVIGEEIRRRAKRLEAELVAGERTTASLEAELTTPDGNTRAGEATFAVMRSEESYERVGVVRDITDRKERERELEKRVHQQEVVTTLGQRALADHDLDALLAEAADLVAETLDNEYCTVFDLDADGEELRLQQGVGWEEGIGGTVTVPPTADGSLASSTLTTVEPVVRESLETDSWLHEPDHLTNDDIQSGISVVIGPHKHPWGVLSTHDPAPAEYAEYDVQFVQSVAAILASAITRHDYEQELVRQREQLVALNNLNEVVNEITDRVIGQSTREEIEETVCEYLARSDSYLFAWVGQIDVPSQTVSLRTKAGVDDALDDAVDFDDKAGPAGRALRRGETQTSQDPHADAGHDPWQRHIDADIRSSAAVPIVHENTVYGVLTVYTERPTAFQGQERAVIDQLGEVVGHAIAAADRKRALMNDELIELEFYVPNVFESVGISDGLPGTITFDSAVPIADDEYIVHGSASADMGDSMTDFAEEIPHWEDVTFRDDGRRFEIRLSEPPVLSVIASVGGSIKDASIENGDYHLTITVSPNVDVRRIIDVCEETYHTVHLSKRQRITQHDEPDSHQSLVTEDLTDRQQNVLTVAYHAGFFEWPRDASGGEIAESLDIASTTFHSHLRKAEQKVFDRLFSGGDL